MKTLEFTGKFNPIGLFDKIRQTNHDLERPNVVPNWSAWAFGYKMHSSGNWAEQVTIQVPDGFDTTKIEKEVAKHKWQDKDATTVANELYASSYVSSKQKMKAMGLDEEEFLSIHHPHRDVP